MGLNERQQKVIELVAEGETITNVAKFCNVSRTTIYSDLDNPDVKAGVDKCIADLKNEAEKNCVKDVNVYINELKKLALTSKNEKIRSDCLQYLCNRIYGNPTSKITNNGNNNDNNKVDVDELVNEINEFKDMSVNK